MLRYLYMYAIYICILYAANLYRALQRLLIKETSCLLSPFPSPSPSRSLSVADTADAATIFSIKIDAVLLHSCVRLNAHNCVRVPCMCVCAVCVYVCLPWNRSDSLCATSEMPLAKRLQALLESFLWPQNVATFISPPTTSLLTRPVSLFVRV